MKELTLVQPGLATDFSYVSDFSFVGQWETELTENC
jgi:hypothetical protein